MLVILKNKTRYRQLAKETSPPKKNKSWPVDINNITENEIKPFSTSNLKRHTDPMYKWIYHKMITV